MAKGFDILTRKHLAKERGLSCEDKNVVIDFVLSSTQVKLYDLPLKVFSSHQGPIPIGTVVGVILRSKESVSVPFVANDTGCNLFPDVKLVPEIPKRSEFDNGKYAIYEQKYHRYYPIYEHFFRIVKNHDDKTYALSPVYLDGGKVLKKELLNRTRDVTLVDTSLVQNDEFIIEEYLEKYDGKSKHDVDLDDNYVSAYKVKQFLEILNKNQTDGSEINVEDLRKNILCLTNRNGSKAGCEAWMAGIKNPLRTFYEGFEKYKDVLYQILDTNEIEAIGSLEKIIENSSNLYNEACDAVGDRIKIPITYEAFESESLCTSNLNVSTLKTISKNLIFRVYLPDQNNYLLSATSLLDWNGYRLPQTILGFLKPGNIVRYFCGKKDESFGAHDYAKIICKIDSQRYFVVRTDQYSNYDENINFILDIRAIVEIPLQFSGNENLELALPSLTPPPQDDNSDEEDPTSFEAQFRKALLPKPKITFEFIEFNYNGLIWQ